MPEILYTKEGYPYYQALPTEGTPIGDASVNEASIDNLLPIKTNKPKPTTYILEPDLMEAQSGNVHVPEDVGFDDAGFPYNKITGQPVQVIRRPNVLPIAPTPDGYTFAMPKMLDVVGNVMGNVGGLAGGKVAANAGEVVLGSGAVSKGKNLDLTYRGSHTAPTRDFGGTLDNLKNIYPDDIYSINGAKYYGHGDDLLDNTTISLIKQFKDKPNSIVTIYRAVPYEKSASEKLDVLNKQMKAYMKRGTIPEGEKHLGSKWYDDAYDRRKGLEMAAELETKKEPLIINEGDWVTINKDYAKQHGESSLRGNYKIISKKVKASDLINDGNSIHEWGYNPTLFSDTRPQVANAVGHAIERNQPFFSTLERAVDNSKIGKATSEQWLGYLKNQPGVKSEELEYVLKDLPEGPITRQQIQQIIKDNKVELNEVWKGGKKPSLSEEEKLKLNKLEERFANKDMTLNTDDAADLAELRMRKEGYPNTDNPTKYSKWQLPGSKNYQELILTLPEAQLKGDKATQFDKLINEGRGDLAARLTKELSETYKSSHWDEPNPIAHIRMNDRIIDGNKSLHLEEIQSDWHQTGRSKGYKGEHEKLAPEFEKIEDKIVKSGNEEVMSQPDIKDALDLAVKNKIITQNEAKIYKRAVDIENYKDSAVPDAPFKKNWDELAFKRMLHKAAKENYDAISWTPGEAQAARYDLSKQLKELQYLKNDDGTYQIAGITAKGDGFNHPKSVTAAKLPDIVGKDMAEKIINNEGKRARGHPANGGYFEGVDLKVGGEGMKAFYDKMLVDKVNAIAKKYGGKVEQKFVEGNHDASFNKPFESRSKAEDVLNRGGEIYAVDRNGEHLATSVKELKELEEEGYGPFTSYILGDRQPKQPVHVLKLTPELKKKALEGFPLFSHTPILNPVSYNPFIEKDKKSNYKLTPIDYNPFG